MSNEDILFFSSYNNKIDKKGRISMPSNFRESIISHTGKSSVILYKSLTKDALEGSTLNYILNINKAISSFDPFSKEKDFFSTAIFAESVNLDIDQEGRIIIPKNYLNYAKINEQAMFIGKGSTFEIWNPDAFEKYSKECREFAIQNAKMIKW